jgi:hypothetical protein
MLRQSQERCPQLLEVRRAQSTDRIPAWRSRETLGLAPGVSTIRHVIECVGKRGGVQLNR